MLVDISVGVFVGSGVWVGVVVGVSAGFGVSVGSGIAAGFGVLIGGDIVAALFPLQPATRANVTKTAITQIKLFI